MACFTRLGRIMLASLALNLRRPCLSLWLRLQAHSTALERQFSSQIVYSDRRTKDSTLAYIDNEHFFQIFLAFFSF